MAQSFYFYDLETTGVNPRVGRIMQFAGQRTDMDLVPIGEPDNVLIKLTDEIVPDPEAILITGITPQQTIQEGITEAEFLDYFTKHISTAGTIFVGYNSVRFDDEFMRYLHYRNFYDPYEWQWADKRSRWDLLDVVRMTRALRPEGIEWPFDSKGKPSNRLELLTSVNHIDHDNAHDALSDVRACIAVAKLLKDRQPKLFSYLLDKRSKREVAKIVQAGQPFVYTSGKYPSEYEKTTVVDVLADHPNRSGAALVYDLRHDPRDFAQMNVAEIVKAWQLRQNEEGLKLPVKTLLFNRCPAIAPVGVLDEAAQKRIDLQPERFQQNRTYLQQVKEQLRDKVLSALEYMDKKQQAQLLHDESDVDSQLYEGFFDTYDKTHMSVVRAAQPHELNELTFDFKDHRLRALLPLYIARNFPTSMSDEQRAQWEEYRRERLLKGGESSRLAQYFRRLSVLASQAGLTPEQQYLLEELQLYGQSIMPEQDA